MQFLVSVSTEIGTVSYKIDKHLLFRFCVPWQKTREMATSKNHVLKLYKTMLRESQKFSSYNYRLYALRRIRDGFRAGKSLTDPTKMTEALQKAEENLEVIKRQVLVGRLYAAEKLVIEKKSEKELESRPATSKS